jgi:hypothetical protein
MRLASLVNTNTGVMLNLVTNDTQKIVDAATFFHFGKCKRTTFCVLRVCIHFVLRRIMYFVYVFVSSYSLRVRIHFL